MIVYVYFSLFVQRNSPPLVIRQREESGIKFAAASGGEHGGPHEVYIKTFVAHASFLTKKHGAGTPCTCNKPWLAMLPAWRASKQETTLARKEERKTKHVH